MSDDLDERLRALDPQEAARYFRRRERFMHERLPLYVQSPFGRLVLEDIRERLSKLVEAMPRTRARLKW